MHRARPFSPLWPLRPLLALWLSSALLLAAVAGCDDDQRGAILLRWRLVDQATGTPLTDCQDITDDNNPLVTQASVDTVHLLIFPLLTPDTAGDSDGGDSAGTTLGPQLLCTSCTFACNPPEHTTNFDIPAGNYRLSIEATRCGRPVGDTPPAVVRAVRAGEVTNLDAIEILIPPRTYTCPAAANDTCPNAADAAPVVDCAL